MPARLIMPWKGELAEIRCCDVEARSLDEFKEYIAKYEGPTKRFVDPHFPLSAPVRVFFRQQSHIVRYMLNYMARDRRYTEEFRNCQAFASDFFGFVAGKKDIKPFSRMFHVGYKQRSHLFMYVRRLWLLNPQLHEYTHARMHEVRNE